MAGRQVKYEITADDQSAMAAFKRVSAETRTAEAETRKLSAATAKHGEAVKGVSYEVKGLRGEFASFISTAVGIATVTAALGKMHEASAAARAEMKAAGDGMRQLAMGESGNRMQTQEVLRRAAATGKGFGFKAGESGAIFDWASDISHGDPAKAQKAAIEAMRLEAIGVDREDIQATMPLLLRQKYTPERASALIAGGMDELHVSARIASKIAARGGEFGSAADALAAAKVLQAQGGLTERELGGAVDATAGVFSGSKLSAALAKKYTAAGIDPATVSMRDKLADIGNTFGTDPAKLRKKFDLSEDASKGLSILLANQGQFASEQSRVAAIPTDFAATRLATMRATPALHEFYAGRDREADRDYAQNFGKFAKERRREGDVARSAAARYETNKYTRDWLTNAQGETNMLGGFAQKIETNPLLGAGAGFMGVQAARDLSGVAGPTNRELMTDKQIEKLHRALERNSNVTEANTRSTGGDVAAPSSRPDRNAGL
jgi:hypothetical protein